MKRARLVVPVLAVALSLLGSLPAGAATKHARMETYRAEFSSVYGKFVSAYKSVITDLTVGNRAAFTRTIVNLDANVGALPHNSPSPAVNTDARQWVAAVQHAVRLGLLYANAPSTARSNTFANALSNSINPAQKLANAITGYLKSH